MFDFAKTVILVCLGIFGFGGWFYFCLLVDQRYDCPTLQKICKWGNAILLVTLFAIIIKFDLWC